MSQDTTNKDELKSNLFEYLNLEEPLPFDNGAAPSSEQANGKKTPELGLDGNAMIEERMFAFFCFKDFESVRDTLKEAWVGYRQGRVSLLAASLTTNVAIDLVRRAEKDLVWSFPEYSNYKEYIIFFFLFWKRSPGTVDLQASAEVETDDKSNTRMSRAEEFICPGIWGALKIASEYERTNVFPEIKPCLQHTCFLELMSTQNAHELEAELKILLPVIEEYIIIYVTNTGFPCEDELSGALEDDGGW